MEIKTTFTSIHYQSKVSFQPLLSVLNRTLHHGSSAGVKKLYLGILEYADQHPELQGPIEDLMILEPHREWMEMLFSIIFPPTASEHEMLYSVGLPFSYTTIYTSRLFHLLFIEPGTNNIKIQDNETGKDIEHDRLIGAYNLILKKYCNYHTPEFVSSVHPYHDPQNIQEVIYRYPKILLIKRIMDCFRWKNCSIIFQLSSLHSKELLLAG
jgi:hypothetical protein